MPIKIHHGPPGSYKTAGALNDDFIREAKAGRVIVTNVRGLTKERVLDQFPDLPDSFDVIHKGDQTEEEREQWAKWFHWVPLGAFIFIDEVQDIWPKTWKDANLLALDYPGGLKKAVADGRPFCWAQAFDKHRHYNWDMVLTTPAYRKVRDDVKGVAEMSYKHKNLGLLGFGGRYIEGAHMADDDGGSPSHFIAVTPKKVKKNVFKIYDSTSTGQVRDTNAGIALLKNPRVVMFLFIIIACLLWVFRPGAAPVLGNPAAQGGAAVQKPGSVPASASGPGSGVAGPSLGAGLDNSSSGLKPFDGKDVYISSAVRVGKVWKYMISFANTDFTNEQVLELGYTVTTYGSCGVLIEKEGWRRLVTCGRPDSKLPPDPVLSSKPDSKAAPSAPSAPVSLPAAAPVG